MSVNNVEKILQYLQVVAKDSILIDGKIIGKKVKHIKLQKGFFLLDDCMQCGCCCPPESNLYTQFEYDYIMNCDKSEFDKEGLDYNDLIQLRSKLVLEKHIINGKEIPFYIYPRDKNELYLPNKGKSVSMCSWLHDYGDGNYRCKVHPIVSITCDMPHFRFHSNKETTSIGIMQFGRNWALGCKVQFHQPENNIEFQIAKENRLRKLHKMNRIAEEFNVDTYLPEIIKYVEKIEFDNYETYLSKDIVSLKSTKSLI